jgi:2,3-bisphosphoglycerate-dependent phosphoglycerate mutase
MPDLILLRHGQSLWNELNLFTGWHDVPLTERGRQEATTAGVLLNEAEGIDISVVHTSLISRAIITANLALETAERSWVPVHRHWRLNERHYGALQGKDKKETRERYGDEQLLAWRRGFATPPPPLDDQDPMQPKFDPRYKDVPQDLLPAAECLADVVVRALPYFHDAIVPDLLREGARGGAVLVVAHGNSLRALRKYLDGTSDDDIVDLEIPTGIPFHYRFNGDLNVISKGYLGDAAAAAKAAAAVKSQAG